MSESKRHDLDHLKSKIDEAAIVADSCPEIYREKCFEVILKLLISSETEVRKEAQLKMAKNQERSDVSRKKTLGELKGEFKAKSGAEFVVMSGYWLEKYDGKSEGFLRSDIRECLKQLRCNFSNPYDQVLKAVTQGYLIEDGKKLLLSQTALDLVASRLEGD